MQFTNNKFNILNFLRIKLKKFNHTKNRHLHKKFRKHIIKPNTVLIMEINACHWETIPSLAHYFIQLGYNVEILTRQGAKNIFQNITNQNMEIYELEPKTFDKIFQTFDFSKYERIIYNSRRVYFKKYDTQTIGYDIKEYYNCIPKGKKDNIYLQHHIDKLQENENDIQIILANPQKNKKLNNLVVNTNYFGNINITKKNKDTVNFVSIGELSHKRKNLPLLLDTVKQLHYMNYKNFTVTIIGKGTIENLSEEIIPYFNILGYVDYPVLFGELEKADFILPLLDAELERHQRYLNGGTSGSFQLAYGFIKPCILHKTFADAYGFNNKNSIVYSKNDMFKEAMIKAINLKDDEYKILQDNLKKTAEEINRVSLDNLKKILLTNKRV